MYVLSSRAVPPPLPRAAASQAPQGHLPRAQWSPDAAVFETIQREVGCRWSERPIDPVVDEAGLPDLQDRLHLSTPRSRLTRLPRPVAHGTMRVATLYFDVLPTGSLAPCGVVVREVDVDRELSAWADASTELPEERNSALAIRAARIALDRAGMGAGDLNLSVVATSTPDHLSPATATLVHRALGLPERAMAFDLNAACSGFLYDVRVAGGAALTASLQLNHGFALDVRNRRPP